MPVPKRKTSKQRRNNRNANKGLAFRAFSSCDNCKEPVTMRQACASCGFYKGAKVIETKADRALKRIEKKAKAEAAEARSE